jgi:thiosulfate/3-mercaptopyruvate sulfurtransferase
MTKEAKISEYAHPEVLVTTDWLAGNLSNVVVVESNEDILLYDTGHIPGAIKLDWHTDLNDKVRRDYLNGEGFAKLMSAKGIARQDTVVIYGDKSNWWAAYAFWVFKLFGHENVRLLDGGRLKWVAEQRELTKEILSRPATDYPVVERHDAKIRAFRDDIAKHMPHPLIDIRSPQEYTGERLHMPDYPNEGAARGGHIPSARNVPWGKLVQEDSTFKPRHELEQLLFKETGFSPNDSFITYCRIGERSSLTWFALKYLLGVKDVKNYDGSWTEWGNLVGVPIAVGEEPGVFA